MSKMILVIIIISKTIEINIQKIYNNSENRIKILS